MRRWEEIPTSFSFQKQPNIRSVRRLSPPPTPTSTQETIFIIRIKKCGN